MIAVGAGRRGSSGGHRLEYGLCKVEKQQQLKGGVINCEKAMPGKSGVSRVYPNACKDLGEEFYDYDQLVLEYG